MYRTRNNQEERCNLPSLLNLPLKLSEQKRDMKNTPLEEDELFGYWGGVPAKNHNLCHSLVNHYLRFLHCVNYFILVPWSFVMVPLPPNLDPGLGITLVPVGLHLEQRLLLLVWSFCGLFPLLQL